MKKGIDHLTSAMALILLFGFAYNAIFEMDSNKKFTIGVTQIATQHGIDLVRRGFMAGMKEQGFKDGQNISYDFQNAQGQMPVAQTIAKKFVVDNVDLIFAITTPSAQSAAKAIKGTKIPLVFCAVTDPISAGIVNSMDKPSGNITGISDIIPVKEQLELLKTILADVQKVGVVFNPGERNSKFMMEIIENNAKRIGLKIIKVSVSNSNEVHQAAQSLVGRCDAFYSGASNTVADAIQSMIEVSEANKLPLLVAASSSVEKGGFGSIGNDYYNVGKEAARLVAEILLKKKIPGDIAVARPTNFEYYFNLKSAKASGVTIPNHIIQKAAKVYK
jgi:putative ABC transport system substrate-binding protein